MSCRWKDRLAAVAIIALAACQGTTTPVPGDRTVTLSWQANHEKGVNAPGGGYRVSIPSRPALDLPYPAPTTLTTVLHTGSYAVGVSAYQPDPETGITTLGAEARLTVIVP